MNNSYPDDLIGDFLFITKTALNRKVMLIAS